MQAFIEFSKELARVSGEVIMSHFRSNLVVETKRDRTPVTIADRQTEQVMRNMIQEAFPDHGIIGEEFGRYQPDADYQWVIDPIDGTINYVTGSFLFGTLIGLIHKNEPILGVLHHPLNQQVLIGTADGTLLNGQPVSVRGCPSIEQAIICSTDHCAVGAYHDFDAYQELICRCSLYRTWGDCHGYYLLASGGIDIMVDPIMHIWDVAALVPIVRGAGGRITDWMGGDPMSGNGVVATAGAIHDEAIRLLNRYANNPET